MSGNIAEDCVQRPHLERIMGRDRDVVLDGDPCGQPDVAAGLTILSISELPQRLRKIAPGKVPRELHAGMTSSLTE